MKYCPNCGAQMADEARFCTSCGMQFANAGPAPEQTNQPPYMGQSYQPYPEQPPVQPRNGAFDCALKIYRKALAVLMKKPFHLWGVYLLTMLLAGLAGGAFALIPVVGLGVSLLLGTALTLIFLQVYRGQEFKTTDIFQCFRDWPTAKRVLCGMGWMYLWIFIWSLIPVVGFVFAIIRSYEYRLTPYILMQEPEVAPTEAIKVSKERTQGWKGKMFLADILFVIAVFVAMLVLGLMTQIPYLGVLFGLAMALVYLAVLALGGLFAGLVQSAFYEEINQGRE